MEEEVTGNGGRVGKKKNVGEVGEVEYKTKAGTAWSHSYLNQKPWHPLSYPNQRRKWIAEQSHANRQRRQEEVAREFSQEQEFFRQTALFNKKEKEKMEMMKAVSFMYVRPPGYNAESAKAAEIEDEKKLSDHPGDATQDPAAASTSAMPDKGLDKNHSGTGKKSRPKDVFGRALPTEEEFEVLKNAPRLDTGAPVRIKPFGVEIRNVRCLRCGNHGHQSGDRECPLKDVIMPNEESRLKRDDPLTAIMAQTDSSEPLKWELKQKPGMSPPRGGYRPDDPNQQIVADDIFDEYGGFLSGGDIPALLSNFSVGRSKKHSKRKNRHKHSSSAANRESRGYHSSCHSTSSSDSETERSKRVSRGKRSKNELSYSDAEVEAGKSNRRPKHKHKKEQLSESSSSSDSEIKIDEGTKRRSNREHRRRRKEKQDHWELSPSPVYEAKSDKESRRHSRRPREKWHYKDSSTFDSEVEVDEVMERHSEREYRRRKKRNHSELSPSPVSEGKSDKESRRHSRRPREKRHCTDSSGSDGLDSDRHSRRRHHRRK